MAKEMTKKEAYREAEWNSELSEIAGWCGWIPDKVWYGMKAIAWYERGKYNEPIHGKVEEAFILLFPNKPAISPPKDIVGLQKHWFGF